MIKGFIGIWDKDDNPEFKPDADLRPIAVYCVKHGIRFNSPAEANAHIKMHHRL